VRIPTPHQKQRDFIQSAARRKVIVAGRRGGKTTGVSILASQRVLEKRRILYAAPTQDQTEMFWDNCKRYFAEGIAAGHVYKNETKRLMQLPGGPRIRAKTAWDADTLRGDYADLLILEEFSLMNPSTWDAVGAPMLLDNDGDAVFIFTPKRKNHAFTFYNRAKGDDTGRWQAWHFTSHDNPHLSKEALEEITADMSDDMYRQEVLAEFLDSEGMVFNRIDESLHAPLDAMPEDHAGHTLMAGCDWGKRQDRTAVSVGCMECGVEVELTTMHQVDYSIQRERVKNIFERWSLSRIVAESNAMGEPIIEDLQIAGLPVMPFQTTATSKPPLIENMALSFERAEFQFLDVPLATAELESYERKTSAITNRSQYSAPAGMHDDTVVARALMLWGGNTGWLMW